MIASQWDVDWGWVVAKHLEEVAQAIVERGLPFAPWQFPIKGTRPDRQGTSGDLQQ